MLPELLRSQDHCTSFRGCRHPIAALICISTSQYFFLPKPSTYDAYIVLVSVFPPATHTAHPHPNYLPTLFWSALTASIYTARLRFTHLSPSRYSFSLAVSTTSVLTNFQFHKHLWVTMFVDEWRPTMYRKWYPSLPTTGLYMRLDYRETLPDTDTACSVVQHQAASACMRRNILQVRCRM